MKKLSVKSLCIILCLMFVLPIVCFAAAAEDDEPVVPVALPDFTVEPEDNATLPFRLVSFYDNEGGVDEDDGFYYLFLPNSLDASSIKVRYSFEAEDISGDTLIEWNPDESYFVLNATNDAEVHVDDDLLRVMRSSLPSMNIVLNEGQSLDTIHADKEAKIKGQVAIDGAKNNSYNLSYTNIEMKTRGNTTFWPDKKPYQIKFDKKTDLFGMGKAKKWILLANYYDGAFVRTKVFFDLAEEIGLSYTSKSVFVDLYIDGDYKGVYQLIEKIEVGSTRVNLTDEYGVILEMESSQRIEAGDICFSSCVFNKPFVYKDYVYDFEDTSTQERRDKIDQIMESVEERINEFEFAMDEKYPDWDTISSMIDVDSFILYYFLCEYGEQVDCTLASTYFYMDSATDVIHCGPVWDFDRVCAFNDPVPKGSDYLKNITYFTDQYRCEWYKELFRNPEFAKRAGELYDERIRAAFDTDKVNGMIDSYIEQLMPSLRMNHVKWVVFYNRDYTSDELLPDGTTEERVAYTVNSIKSILSNKKSYMDKAYGADMPVLNYRDYDTVGSNEKNYTGGCMTYNWYVTGLSFELIDSMFDGGIEYRLNVNGTLTDTVRDGARAMSSSGYQRANGLYLNLYGNVANYYTVQYKVYMNGTWSNWSKDGAFCGRSNSSNGRYQISRVVARLIRKNPIQYSAIHKLGEGIGETTDIEVVGNEYEVNSVPFRAGYEFTGWYTDADCSVPADASFVAEDSDYYLYAGFEERPTIPGDVNGDGEVTAKDILALKKYLVGLDDDTNVVIEKNADLNGDGDITSRDSRAIKQLLVA
ncbi:MAG: CotH kinase family protein [Clostridia bacterium]|nr:CotH kinase family protein [Clostridia bacterium]